MEWQPASMHWHGLILYATFHQGHPAVPDETATNEEKAA
jgi:hypothetical protein